MVGHTNNLKDQNVNVYHLMNLKLGTEDVLEMVQDGGNHQSLNDIRQPTNHAYQRLLIRLNGLLQLLQDDQIHGCDQSQS